MQFCVEGVVHEADRTQVRQDARLISPRNLLLLLWLLDTAYNLFKPYHIDDGAYLEIAKWVRAHPLHPMSGLLNWTGTNQPIYQTNQPPLYFYLLALWSSAFGFSEPALHSLQSLAALACIFLFYRLARHFAPGIAVWLTALLALGPAFIVEQNLMVDTPLLALWLAFFNVLVCPPQTFSQNRRYSLAALFCSAALLIKYSSLVLVVIFCLSLLMERRKKQLWLAIIPIWTITAWSIFNYFDYGGIHIATRPASSQNAVRILLAFVAWIIAVGAVMPAGLIAAVQNRPISTKLRRAIYSTVALMSIALVLTCFWHEQSPNRVLWVAFLVNGFLLLSSVFQPAMSFVRSKQWTIEITPQAASSVYLGLWVAGTSAFYILLAPFVAARHVLLILPPLLLLWGARWRHSLTWDARIFGLALTAAISAALCISDWRVANFFRSEAASIRHSLPSATIWTNGHWGWQWYAAQQEIRQVDIDKPRMQQGDYFAVPSVDHQNLKSPPPLKLIRTDVPTFSAADLFCTTPYFYNSTIRPPIFLTRFCERSVSLYRLEGP